MKIFQSMEVSASALTAEKIRLDTIANNIANIDTTKTAEGGPFRRKVVVFEEMIDSALNNNFSGKGVRVKETLVDNKTPFRMENNPEHPDADQEGNVYYSNVDLSAELIDMMTAQRSYQANASVFTTSRTILEKALDINRG